MDFAAAFARVRRTPERKFPYLPSRAQPALSKLPAVESGRPAELVVFATIGAVAKIVAAAQAALFASAQIIARAHMKVRRRKSRPAQPSAIEFAYTSPIFSNENLFLSPSDFLSSCDFIACYCCGPKFRMAAAACRRM
jgi:hypothetical protein